MKKKITNYLTNYLVIMIVGMAIFVIMDSFERQATPLMWVIILITTAWLAYTLEIGGKNE
ncbi:hypothetical protein [Lactococcus petauri]|uniref:hypothetical protein n=1 Tax=Lactococcus petauri TaxID=1940789 RepID=UPI00255106E4|nr:hypothetical protein [Lactococcus petauri]